MAVAIFGFKHIILIVGCCNLRKRQLFEDMSELENFLSARKQVNQKYDKERGAHICFPSYYSYLPSTWWIPHVIFFPFLSPQRAYKKLSAHFGINKTCPFSKCSCICNAIPWTRRTQKEMRNWFLWFCTYITWNFGSAYPLLCFGPAFVMIHL